jgi:uncharacterized protein (DUF362 family)/NAD-dependent dihydropyrimidine dehydrogenase PreA subunit
MEKYKVSVVKCYSYNNNEVKTALEESLKNINFDLNLLKNKKVLIKPNILGPYKPEQAITTHPVVIEELCKILKKYKAEIYIGDSSGMFIDTELAIKVSGISSLSKYAKIINFDKSQKKIINIGKNKIPIPKIIDDFYIINVPKMKTHGLTKITLCIKNIFGCIIGDSKSNIHRIMLSKKEFAKFLLELNEKIKPQLNIIDGIIGLEGEGPGTSGIPIKSNLIISSRNPAAADIITSEIMGFDYKDIYTNRFSKIKKQEIEVLGNGQDIKLNFKKPTMHITSFFRFLLPIFPLPRIKFHKNKCIKCLKCEKKCPVNAIKILPMQTCNYKKCINCLCCIEVCPNSAIYLEEHWLKKLARKIIRKNSKV